MQISPFLILTIDSKDFLKETQDKFIFTEQGHDYSLFQVSTVEKEAPNTGAIDIRITEVI
jgi:hypothetical protein